MNAFLWMIFVLQVLNVILSIINTSGDHPRHKTPSSVGADATTLILNIAIMAWVAFFLFGNKRT